jgi:hypothetical protein
MTRARHLGWQALVIQTVKVGERPTRYGAVVAGAKEVG